MFPRAPNWIIPILFSFVTAFSGGPSDATGEKRVVYRCKGSHKGAGANRYATMMPGIVEIGNNTLSFKADSEKRTKYDFNYGLDTIVHTSCPIDTIFITSTLCESKIMIANFNDRQSLLAEMKVLLPTIDPNGEKGEERDGVDGSDGRYQQKRRQTKPADTNGDLGASPISRGEESVDTMRNASGTSIGLVSLLRNVADVDETPVFNATFDDDITTMKSSNNDSGRLDTSLGNYFERSVARHGRNNHIDTFHSEDSFNPWINSTGVDEKTTEGQERRNRRAAERMRTVLLIKDSQELHDALFKAFREIEDQSDIIFDQYKTEEVLLNRIGEMEDSAAKVDTQLAEAKFSLDEARARLARASTEMKYVKNCLLTEREEKKKILDENIVLRGRLHKEQ